MGVRGLTPDSPAVSSLGEGSKRERGARKSGSPSPMQQKRSILCPPPCHKNEVSSVIPRATKTKYPLSSPLL